MHSITWVTIATTSPMGQQRYEQEIQAALRRVAGPDWSFELVTVTSARSTIAGAKRIPHRFNNAAPLLLSRASGRMLYGRPDLVHRFDLRLPAAWGREVVTIHDLPPLRFPDEGRLTRSAAAGARRAARVIVPSRFGGEELAELIGITDAEIIPYGLSAEYADSGEATDDDLLAIGICTPFLLHAAGASLRKNLAGLAAAWQLLSARHPDLTLVLCGPPDPRRDRLFDGAVRVVKTGRLESSRVGALMRRASAVIVPSVYEGFGLPALEGMACGAPVVAVRRGALPEVCDDASLLVEPDGQAIANGIEKVLSNQELAEGLREQGRRRAAEFDWDRAAREHLRVYHEALNADTERAKAVQ